MNSQWNNFGGCAEGSSHPAANKAVLIEALIIKPVVTAMGTIHWIVSNQHQGMSFFKSTQILKLWSCRFILSCLQDINLETIEISFEQKDSKEASPFFCNIIVMTNYFFPLGKAAQKYSGNNTFSLTWRLSSLHPHCLHPFNHRKIIIW